MQLKCEIYYSEALIQVGLLGRAREIIERQLKVAKDLRSELVRGAIAFPTFLRVKSILFFFFFFFFSFFLAGFCVPLRPIQARGRNIRP